MFEPLSKVLGLQLKRGAINHFTIADGYNQAIYEIDQLSPDVHKLSEIIRK